MILRNAKKLQLSLFARFGCIKVCALLLLLFFLTACVPTSSSLGLNTLKSQEQAEFLAIYDQKFQGYFDDVSQLEPHELFYTGFSPSRVLGYSDKYIGLARLGLGNAKYYTLLEDINHSAMEKGLRTRVAPVVGLSAKERDAARYKIGRLKEEFKTMFKDSFNPYYVGNYHGHLPKYETFANSLSNGHSIPMPTGYFVGDVNDAYYHTVYIVAVVFDINGFSLDDRVRAKLHYQKTPFISQNKNMRRAEIAIKNLDLPTAEKYYVIARQEVKDPEELQEMDQMYQKFKNLPNKWENWQQRASAVQAEIKRKSNESGVSFSHLMMGGLSNFTNEMVRINDKLAAQNMVMTNALANAYTQKTVNKLVESNNALVGAHNQSSGAMSKATSSRRVALGHNAVVQQGDQSSVPVMSEDVFNRRKEAVNELNDAQEYMRGLEKVSSDLLPLFGNGTTSGKDVTIKYNRDRASAQRRIEYARERVNSLEEKEGVEFSRYMNQNRHRDGDVTSRLDENNVQRYYDRIRNNYHYFYLKLKEQQ